MKQATLVQMCNALTVPLAVLLAVASVVPVEGLLLHRSLREEARVDLMASQLLLTLVLSH